jgi:hypothetical protein
MNRTTWLQDRRMQKFRDVLSRWERKELSAMEAGELWGARSAAVPALPSALYVARDPPRPVEHRYPMQRCLAEPGDRPARQAHPPRSGRESLIAPQRTSNS